MAIQITIERILEQRDVDAALYLLERMLSLNGVGTVRRTRLALLKRRLSRSRHLHPGDRETVISSYRELIG